MQRQSRHDGHTRTRRSRQQSAANPRHRGPPLNRTASFSHIQIVAHPGTSVNGREEPTGPFVQNRSLQDELYNSDEYEHITPTLASTPGFASFSFAQVVASMPANGRSGRGNSRDMADDREAKASPAMGPAQLSSLGNFRYTLKAGKKKTKKWSPLDLGGSEVEFEVGDPTIPKADESVPGPSTSDQGTSCTSPVDIRYAKQLEEFSPEKSTIGTECRDSFFDSCDTPTGTAFNAAFPQLRPTPTKSAHERSIIHKEDPEDTKQRLEDIMARIDDVFDVEEWDPNLPAGDHNNSPEPLIVEPQRVTYTTVGSVAKTDSVPTFTAPVRIQREGAGRRVPILPAPPRGFENYYARNQHHSQYNPQQFVPPSPFNLAELEKFNLTDLEKETLLETLSSSAAAVCSGNIPTKPQIQQISSLSDKARNDAPNGDFSIQRMMQEETSGPSTQLAGSSAFAGLNKMQTLQRLAQFDNPAQVFAKGRLAEFKAVKMKQHMSDMAASRANGASQAHALEQGNRDGMPQFGYGSDSRKTGFQGYNSHYPGSENDNPLQASQGFSAHEYAQHGYASRGLTAPPGYPQPLTAGPPGQRHNSVAVNRLAWDSGYNQTTGNSQPLFHHPHVEKQCNPWNNSYEGFTQQSHNTFSSVVTEDNQVRDTLSLAEMSKYFPGGFGPGFHVRGEYRALDHETRLSNLGLADKSKTEQQLTEEKLDKWFYSGLDRFSMTIDDHIEELENRDTGILPPIQRPNFADREILSVRQVTDKSGPECADPLLSGLFGTLVAYSDNVIQPTNRRILSKFVPSPAWALDISEEGKKSIFGDNWVAPPKRLGRDPRYQRPRRSEMRGNDSSHGY